MRDFGSKIRKQLAPRQDYLASWNSKPRMVRNGTLSFLFGPVRSLHLKAVMITERQYLNENGWTRTIMDLFGFILDLERIKNTKLLGVHLNENLLSDEHFKNLASSCYATLASLRKIKHFTPYKLRKHLAESLILSRLDYCDIVMFPLPQHLLKRLQRIQFAAASFVTGRYVNSFESLLKLDWLPVR